MCTVRGKGSAGSVTTYVNTDHRKDGIPVWQLIAWNTYEHYQGHGKIIEDWLSRSQY